MFPPVSLTVTSNSRHLNMSVFDERTPDGEIVGLDGRTNGRSCDLHHVCGSVIKVDSLIRFKWCSVKIQGRVEVAIKAVVVCGGQESCTVGFLPRTVSLQPGAKDAYHDEFAVIVFLHSDSEDTSDVEASRQVLGKGYYRLLKNVPSLE